VDNAFAGIYKAFGSFGNRMEAAIKETFDKDPPNPIPDLPVSAKSPPK
jgi:hypothetical protein